MENSDFSKSIYPYLKIYNEYFNAAKKSAHKTPLLILEGKTDVEFFHPLFEKSYFSYNGRRILFNTQEKKMICDFQKSVARIMAFSSKREIDKTQIVGDTDDFNCMKFEYVANCVSVFEKHQHELNEIDCFGFIDKDFGHKDLMYGLNRISDSTFHDREMCVLRCCLPDFISLCPNKTASVIILSEIICTAFKQGIIEKESHECGSNAFKRLTHGNFMVHCKEFDFKSTSFDFNCYLNDPNNVYRGKFKNTYKPSYDSNYCAFTSKAKSEINRQFDFEGELCDILSRWLITTDTTSDDEMKIDKIFEYCNGHLVLSQMSLNSSYFLNLSIESEIVDYILSEILIRRGKYKELFELLPLKKYKAYRENNGFFVIA